MTMLALQAAVVTFVLSAGLAVAWWLRRGAATVRHAVLVAAVIGAAVSPLIVPLVPARSLRARPSPALPSVEVRQPAIVATGAAVATSPPITPFPYAAVSLSLCALAVALGLGRFGRDLRSVGRLMRRSATCDDARLVGLVRSLCDRAGVPPVELRLGTTDAPVVTWGVVRPRSLLPLTAVAWPEARATQVLAHEVAHVVRRDPLWHLVLGAATAAYAWHPLMWRSARLARAEAERAADDAVLQAGVRPSDYATTLLELARDTRPHPSIATGVMGAHSPLELRITAMLDTSLDHACVPARHRVRAALTMFALTLGVAALAAQARGDGTVAGAISPGGGTPLAGVTVTFTNGEVTRSATTDGQGLYTVSLPAGTYAADIRVRGFKPFSARVDVVAGEATTRDLALALGTVRETVTVAQPSGPPEPGFALPIPPVAPPPAGVQDQSRVLEPPRKLRNVVPRYPVALHDNGVAGKVVVSARIGIDGYVTDTHVVSSPHDSLSTAAVEAIEHWRFSPTIVQGQRVPTDLTVTVEFALQR